MRRTVFVLAVFITLMLLSIWLLGCQTRDITFFSQTGTIQSQSGNRQVRPLPRQMTTKDLINRGRAR